MGEVAVIGLDAFGFLPAVSYLRDFIRAAGTPSVMYVYEAVPPYTAPSWTTLFTGVSPCVHGVYSMYRVSSRGGYVSFSGMFPSSDVRFPFFFEVAALYGLTYAAINVPMTSPTKFLYRCRDCAVLPLLFNFFREVPTSLDTRLIALAEGIVRLQKRLLKCGRYRLYGQLSREVVARQIELCERVINDFEPDVFVTVFKQTDTYLHMWPQALVSHDENYSCIVREIGDFVSRVLKRFKHVFVVSDHGYFMYSEEYRRVPLLSIPASPRRGRRFPGISRFFAKAAFLSRGLGTLYLRYRLRAGGGGVLNTKFAVACEPVDAIDAWVMFTSKDTKLTDLVVKMLETVSETARVEVTESSGVNIIVVHPSYSSGEYTAYIPNADPKSLRKVVRKRCVTHNHHPIAVGMYYGYGGCGEGVKLYFVDERSFAPSILAMLNLPVDTLHRGSGMLPGLRHVGEVRYENLRLKLRTRLVAKGVKRRFVT